MASKPRWSPRIRIPVIGRLLTFNWGRRGPSWSLKLGWVTFNSRGEYSINGPGILDYRGRWLPRKPRGATSPLPREVAPREVWGEVDEVPAPPKRRRRGSPAKVCGARFAGGPACMLTPGSHDWHVPDPARGEPWRAAWRS